MAVSVQNWSTLKSFKGAGPKVSLKTDLGTVDALELGAVVRETWALTDSAQEGEQAGGIKQEYCSYLRLLVFFFFFLMNGS